jgi:hypothetical protein
MSALRQVVETSRSLTTLCVILDEAPLYSFCTTCIPGTESLLDRGVSGDGSVEGLTFSFDDDEPMEGASLICHQKTTMIVSHIEKMYSKDMNSEATVQCGLVLSIYFAGKVILLWLQLNPFFVTWATEKIRIQSNDDDVVFVDRGYNVASVIRLVFGLRCQILRTHSGNAGKWPFCTGGNPKHWQILVPIEWALPFFDKKDQQRGVSGPLLRLLGVSFEGSPGSGSPSFHPLC